LGAVALSVISLGLTYLMPEQKSVDPETEVVKNPIHVFDYVGKTLKYKFDDWAYLIGIAWFWVLMSLVGMLSGEYGQNILQARWSVMAFLSGAIFRWVILSVQSFVCVLTANVWDLRPFGLVL
jgi:hypothetical protein